MIDPQKGILKILGKKGKQKEKRNKYKVFEVVYPAVQMCSRAVSDERAVGREA